MAVRRPTPAAVRWLPATAAALCCAGCSWLPDVNRGATGAFLGFITPYRIEVVQGNVVTREQAARIKPGMTRLEVRDLLGSPMLTDPFHGERWDYVFTIRRQGVEAQRRSVVAWFNGDVLERLDAPDLPSENEFVSSIARPAGDRAIPTLELTPAQRTALPRQPTTAEAAAPPMGATRSYPPLEPS